MSSSVRTATTSGHKGERCLSKDSGRLVSPELRKVGFNTSSIVFLSKSLKKGAYAIWYCLETPGRIGVIVTFALLASIGSMFLVLPNIQTSRATTFPVAACQTSTNGNSYAFVEITSNYMGGYFTYYEASLKHYTNTNNYYQWVWDVTPGSGTSWRDHFTPTSLEADQTVGGALPYLVSTTTDDATSGGHAYSIISDYGGSPSPACGFNRPF